MKKNYWIFYLAVIFILCSCSKAKLGEKKSSFSRIVCLSPSGAEILCDLGLQNKIVARTDFCDYPSEILSVKSIGGFDGKTFSLESIISLNPDFVYGSLGMHDYLKSQLDSFGIKNYFSNAESINSIKDEILYIGNLFDVKENTEKIVADLILFEDKVKLFISENENVDEKKVYYEVWNSPYMSVGKKSYINEMISLCGKENIFRDLNESYPLINEEYVVLNNPDYIILPDKNGLSLDNIKNRAAWNEINAVKNGRIYFINSDLVSRSGPRIKEAIIELLQCFYSDFDRTILE